eukprot:CCRYP_019043-RA/>CCRYP_019043-RA protein AED:0.03 eAED:-0.02 QI:0/0/0/1/1/1/3/0/737
MADSLEGYERYRQFMDRLTENNVDEYIDLPMIAVMGDTSSGKSSLLSNISLVELPSNDNLTTRCPIMLKMHCEATRSACVKVSWKDKPNAKGVDFAEISLDEENWHSITDAIAAAQLHIINKTGKEVARDVVSVDIRGPHCQNLTLIDLPGIVRTTGKSESATLAEDIHALMNDYLENPRCVILAVLPCNVDFHNSQILAEARKVDPDTKRTIPVLTKPDLIHDGAQAAVKELLLGKKTDSFQMGFHMIKGRGQAALNSNESIEEGLKKEESFFNNTDPWKNIDDKNLLGTKKLRAKLAQLQMDIIRLSFKSIVVDLKARQEDSMNEYILLGEIPSNLTEKRALFRSVREDIWKGIGASVLSGHIPSLNNASRVRPSAKFLDASQRYQDSLNATNLATVHQGGEIGVVSAEEGIKGEVCFIDDIADKVYLKDKVASRNVSKSSFKEKKCGEIFQHSSHVYIKRKDGTVDVLESFNRELFCPDPEWISTLIQHNRPYKLPIFINTDVFEALVADLIENEWAPPSMELLDFTSSLMDEAVEEFIKDMKKVKSFPILESFLVDKGTLIIDSLKKDVRAKVKDFIEREKVPYTQNHYLFENVCKLRSQRLMDEVLSAIKGQYGTGTFNVHVVPHALSSMIKNIFEKNQRRSVQDHMTEDMQNALNSYGKVALKRFIDNVPMYCIEIMQKFADKMNDILSDISDEEIDRIVSAPLGIVEKRNALKRKSDVLQKGILALRELY